jgi:hypothetical protein
MTKETRPMYPFHTRITGSIHAFSAHASLADAVKTLKCQGINKSKFIITNYDTGEKFDATGKPLPA